MLKVLLLTTLVSMSFSLSIFPPPRIITDKASTWPITAETRIVVGSIVSSQDSFTAILLQQDLKQFSGITVPIIRESEVSVAGHRIIIGQPGKDTLLARVCAAYGVTMSDSILKADTVAYRRTEGYELECGEDVILAAPSSDGVFYGVRTLFQILDEDTSDGRGNGPAFFNKVRITDWPRSAYRGVMYDPGREPYKLNQVKRLIRLNTRFKLNTLHIHFYDDQLMGIKFKDLPMGSENPAAWPLDSIRDLVRYARLYHMEIIPEFEIPGHNASLVYWYKDLRQSEADPDMDFRDPRCLWLYERMLMEIAPIFESSFIHIGTDEASHWMPPGKDIVSLVWPVVDRVNRRHGRNYKIIRYDYGCPDSLADHVVLMLWGAAAPDSYMDSQYANSKCKMLYQPWGPANLWTSRYKFYENFFGLDMARWETNYVEPGWEITANNFMWNPYADSAANWDTHVSQIKRMPETQGWPASGHYAAYTDPFSLPEEGAYPDFPNFSTPTYRRNFKWDTLAMYCINPLDDTLPVTDTRILAQDTVVEQFLSIPLSVVTTYQGGAKDTSTDKVTYIPMDRTIATVNSSGRVFGVTIGSARIRVLRRTTSFPDVPAELADTITISVVQSTAAVDSIRLSFESMELLETESYPLKAAGFCHNGAEYFQRAFDTLDAWISLDTSLVRVDNGIVAAVNAGGPVAVVAVKSGVSDTAWITVQPRPDFIKRINFSPDTTLTSFGWLQADGGQYSGARGFGWTTAWHDGRAGRNGNAFVSSFIIGTGNDSFKLDVPAGEYVIRTAMGDNQYGVDAYGWVVFGTDTISRKMPGTANSIQDDTITLAGDMGLALKVFGPINYLVIISSEGIDISQVAYDSVAIPPLVTAADVGANNYSPLRMSACPNPFNPVVTITLSGNVKPTRLAVYDIRGKMVANLLPDFRGHSVAWNARTPAGMYVVRAEVNGRRLVKRVLLVK